MDTARPNFVAARLASPERSISRRITIVWGLLIFNVIEFSKQPMVFPIPHTPARLLTQGSLVVALLIALSVNRRLIFRPNAFLTVATSIGLAALLTGIAVSTFHGDLRALRVVLFVLVLWLLTPWWGRDDLMLARLHLNCFVVVLSTVVLGFVISPHRAVVGGRLEGALWPITATGVAHYAAIATGIAGIMFLAGEFSRVKAAVLFFGGVGILVFSHTRTATVALIIGLLVASLSLVSWRRRTRRLLLVFLALGLVAGATFRPALIAWFSRGQNATSLNSLTGRTRVWALLETTPRTKAQIMFGFGLSNASFNGAPIDNSWLSTYQQAGLLGDVLDGVLLLVLLLLAVIRPRSPARAVAIFLIVYCLIASFTEDGLGYPSLYMLDLCVAAAMLAPSIRPRKGDVELS